MQTLVTRVFGIVLLFSAVGVAAASLNATEQAKVVAQATAGRMKAIKGKYFDRDCNEFIEYEAEVVDLNGDGQPEVFTTVLGACLGGAAGVEVNLYIKTATDQWKPQFGFPGGYKVLSSRNKGFLDIEIAGPGICSPVWRWNGQKYSLHKKCD